MKPQITIYSTGRYLFNLLLFVMLTLNSLYYSSKANAATPILVDAGNGTIVDTVNNLSWLKNANCFGLLSWDLAMYRSNHLESGQCNLNDLSKVGDWRLPTVQEMWSLSERGNNFIPLNAAGFIDIQESWYWASDYYCVTSVHGGAGGGTPSDMKFGVWPVRSGQFWAFGSLVLSASLDYNSPIVGGLPIVREVTITNSDLAGSKLVSISITGADANSFTVDAGGRNPCASLTQTLGEGEACTVLVTCNPTLGGLKNANLTVATNSVTGNVPITANVLATVYGNISDLSTDMPVDGATVTLMPVGTIASTKSDGSYTFGNLSPATYSVSVAKAGYQTTAKTNLVTTSTTAVKADLLLPTTGALNITSTSLPWASPSVEYSNRIMVSGGTVPYSYRKTYGTFPTGLSLDKLTGVISGIPIGIGSYNFAIGITDTVANYSEQEFSIELLPPLEITTASLPPGQQGAAYLTTISASGGKLSYSFSMGSGTLPKGITLDTSGTLSGTPRETGDFSITIKVTDSTGRTYDKNYSLTMSAAPVLAMETAAMPSGLRNNYYSTTLAASGGVPPLTYNVLEALSAGLSIDSSTGVSDHRNTLKSDKGVGVCLTSLH